MKVSGKRMLNGTKGEDKKLWLRKRQSEQHRYTGLHTNNYLCYYTTLDCRRCRHSFDSLELPWCGWGLAGSASSCRRFVSWTAILIITDSQGTVHLRMHTSFVRFIQILHNTLAGTTAFRWINAPFNRMAYFPRMTLCIVAFDPFVAARMGLFEPCCHWRMTWWSNDSCNQANLRFHAGCRRWSVLNSDQQHKLERLKYYETTWPYCIQGINMLWIVALPYRVAQSCQSIAPCGTVPCEGSRVNLYRVLMKWREKHERTHHLSPSLA